MDDVIMRFRSASQALDVPGMTATLAPDVALVSPLSARLVFRGQQDVSALPASIYATFSAVRWDPPIGADNRWVLIGDAQLGPLRLGDAMLLELDQHGHIATLRPHLRPWLSVTALALLLGPRLLLSQPGALRRAWSNER